MVLFCFVMSLGLAAILSQAGRLYTASPWWVIVGIAVWLVVLLGTILWTSSRMNAAVLRIRSETGTGDAEYSAKLAAVGLKLFQPIRYESGARLLGWPLFALRIGSRYGKSDKRDDARHASLLRKKTVIHHRDNTREGDNKFRQYYRNVGVRIY